MIEIETRTRENADKQTASQLVFYFDPLCPWAWRASQWIREVQRQQRLDVDWRIFSLGEANGIDEPRYWLPVRLIALAKARHGSDVVGPLYEAIGTRLHESDEDSGEPESLEKSLRDALSQVHLDPSLLDEAMRDSSTMDEVRDSHYDAQQRYGAYGVPWLVIPGCDFGFNGPIIDEVPRGDEALELWRHASWLLSRPYFYEFKRERG